MRFVLRLSGLLVGLCLLYPGLASAATPTSHDYAQSARGKALINKLYREHHIPRATTRALLADAHYEPQIIAKMERPPEKTMTWGRYRQIFLQPDRAAQGAQYIAAHRALFDAAEAKYGVSRYIIAAILGVETRYGRFVGHDRVLDALATLAFDYPPRHTFFTKELAVFIRLCVSDKLDCTKDVGSYAGAMGLGQFMPSSYAAYAVDGNGDGRRDLWHEPADIIDSIANYLAKNGWQRGGAIAEPAYLARAAAINDITPSKRKTRYDWRQLERLGVRVDNPPSATTRVGLLALTGLHGTPDYWLAQHNFFVITTYNSSPLYALAVDQLADMIAADDARRPSS